MQSFITLEMDEMEFKKPGLGTEHLVLDTIVDLPLPLSTRSSQAYPGRPFSKSPALSAQVDYYPDGGPAAWGVLFGATCAIFATLGIVNSWGVFQTYYQQNLLRDTKSSTIASIGSVQLAFVFFPGLFAGRLCDLGYYRQTLFIASLTLVGATAATAQCKEFWQLLLCQGFLTGLSCGMIFTPIPSVLSHWFKKRMSLAFGISTTGASIGGAAVSIGSSHLLERIGYQWTMRVIALTVFCLLAVANLTLKRRLPPPKNPGPFFIWDDLRKPAFTVYIIACAINYLGLFTVFAYIDLSALAIGISPGFSFYLVAIVNGAACVGQILAGFMSDQIGAINVTVPMTVGCAAMTFFWPFATTKMWLIIIAIIYGFCNGAYVSLIPAPLVLMGEVNSAGRRTGIAGSTIALGAGCGLPIAGAIMQSAGGFKPAGYYSGSCIVVAAILQCVTKYLMRGTLRGKF